MLTKRPLVATTVPSDTNTVIRALVYRVYLRIYDRGPNNSTTFPGICSPSDYKQPIESSLDVPTFKSMKKALKFTIYDYI